MLSLLFFCRISEDKRKGLCCSGKFGTIQQNSVRKGVCDVEVYEGGAHHAAGRRVLGLVRHVQSVFVLRTGNGYAVGDGAAAARCRCCFAAACGSAATRTASKAVA